MKKEKEEAEAKFKHALVDDRKEQVRGEHAVTCVQHTVLTAALGYSTLSFVGFDQHCVAEKIPPIHVVSRALVRCITDARMKDY